MKRIAIVGAGISGVTAAYELARQQQAGTPVEFTLFEAGARLGGTVETVRRDEFVIECGPDSWVSEKPWARELAVELGLESELIFSCDQHRRTYLAEGGKLDAMPDGMRMMVPVEWSGVLASPLFTAQAKLDYRREPQRAEHLKATSLDATGCGRDESVRDFVIRHFGSEVADTIAAPLLAGVFGGDIATLSARAVLPAFVALEREHGSLILGLQQRKRAAAGAPPIFTSLRHGLFSLIEAMESRMPGDRIHRGCGVGSLELQAGSWHICDASGSEIPGRFDAVFIATPPKTTTGLLAPLDPGMAELLPADSSSAIVVAFAFSTDQAVHIPQGFGFLVPQRDGGEIDFESSHGSLNATARRGLLACTFVDQKFPHRAPPGAVLLRAFFGGAAAPALLGESDETLARLAHRELERILGKLPQPANVVIRRWPDSLPLYTVGHLDRIAEVESRARRFPNLVLIGNAYHGVGLPDLIHQGRSAAREIVRKLAGAGGSRQGQTA